MSELFVAERSSLHHDVSACMHAHTCLLHEPEFDVAQQEQIIGAFGPPGATPAVPQMQYGYGSLKRFFFG